MAPRAAAPAGMNASGYADLLAKLTAGADWIVADALGIEPIDPPSWQMVQANLRDWLSDPTIVDNTFRGCHVGIYHHRIEYPETAGISRGAGVTTPAQARSACYVPQSTPRSRCGRCSASSQVV